ncbi:hypothetical protein ACJMK2_042470, partial [Sinanodonta woodiana]
MRKSVTDSDAPTASLKYRHETSCDSLVPSEKDVKNVVVIASSHDGMKAKKRKKVRIAEDDQMTPLLPSTYNGFNIMTTSCTACK